MFLKKNILFICLIGLGLWTLFYIVKTFYKKILNDKFYNYKDVNPSLENINANKVVILNEIHNNLSNVEWIDWPEKHLYDNDCVNGNWKIIPFYGFGIWCKKPCSKFPKLVDFLKSVPGLRIALISKLNPKTKLLPHCGWGNHSNNVLRCHYGIFLPKDKTQSYVSVSDDGKKEEIQFHKLHDWIVFDDSKIHYAENKSDEERVVLIVDVERPSHIKKGLSVGEETDELLEVINKMKALNETN